MSRALLLAAGGTGGHVFPALAVAEALERHGEAVTFLTDARGARFLGPRPHRVVAAAGLTGGLAGRVRAVAALMRGTVEASRLVRELRPRAAALFGGYATLPALFALLLGRVPFVVHEQNAILGRANRLAARFAQRLALSFADTEGLRRGLRRKIVVTGNPVRPGFVAASRPPSQASGRIQLLVTGGSQGARVFAERVPAALAQLPPALRGRLRLWMQCRAEQAEQLRRRLAELEVEAEVRSFFDDLPLRLARADLALTRAGASTVAELLTAGTPAILVPYPHAVADHQSANAARLARAGAALVLPEAEFTPARLASLLVSLLGDRKRLEAMRAAACRLAPRGAAERLARTVIALAGGEETA